jgi:hypothetical protein
MVREFGIVIRVAHHVIAEMQVVHAEADAFHGAGELAARREREWRLGLVFAGDHQDVEEVESGHRHLDDDLAGGSDRIRDVGELQ